MAPRTLAPENCEKMKRVFFVLILSICYYQASSACQVNCKFRYMYRKYYETSSDATYYGDQVGSIPIFGGGGALVNTYSTYEDIWTNTYNGSVIFRTGYEVNEALGRQQFNDRCIVASVKWSNGGYSIITLNNWTTNLKYLTEEELLTNTSTGETIDYLTGNEKNARFWEFFF